MDQLFILQYCPSHHRMLNTPTSCLWWPQIPKVDVQDMCPLLSPSLMIFMGRYDWEYGHTFPVLWSLFLSRCNNPSTIRATKCYYSKGSVHTLICHTGLWIFLQPWLYLLKLHVSGIPFGVEHIRKAWRKLLWYLWGSFALDVEGLTGFGMRVSQKTFLYS